MKIEQFITKALKYKGFPSILYKEPDQGRDESGFDCSGFIYFLLESYNLAKPNIRHCNEFFDSFGILVHYGLHKKGDLVFFSKNGVYPTHIGIMVSETEYIHAPGKNNTKVELETLEQKVITPEMHVNHAEYEQIYKTNPIGFKRITIRRGRYQRLL